ncbi:MAG: alpha-hydroxy-acid oxidizing protein [Hyphomicrobiaceae bacterium]|nr:alpha-hydroxy-acid oxidizing protein [Hyphomicrobiaceae bacterium]
MARAQSSSQTSYETGTAEGPLDIINLYDLEAKAREVIPKGAFGYIRGGSGDEWTLKENTRAFDDRQILPRYLAGFDAPNTEIEILGSKLDVPLFVPPMAAHGLAHVTAERGSAKGAGDAGALFCAQTLANVPLEDIAKANPGPKWFQLYFMEDQGVNRELIQRAKAAGCTAIVFTVDLEWPDNREADERNNFVFPESLTFPSIPNAPVGASLADLGDIFKKDLSFADIEFIARESGLPVVVKGLLTPDNARECVARGAAAIQVSNHGGRQLDTVPAAITALPGIVEAVDPDVPVLLDSGPRRGVHVFQALALGARAVGVGRPTLYSLALGGAPGVQSMFETLKEEFQLAMKLAGCASIQDITRRYVT